MAALCDRFRRDARSLRLKEGEHQVDDVSNTLKRFFRELEEGLFTSEDAHNWLSTAGKLDICVHFSRTLCDKLTIIHSCEIDGKSYIL